MLMPKVVIRTSTRTTLSIAFLCYSAAHVLFASSSATTWLVLAAICAGTGFGFSIPLLNHATVENSTDHNRGRNLSLFAMAVFSGQFITSALEFIPSLSATLYTCALLSVASVLVLAIKRPRLA